jgi:hypothetical protein
MPARAETTTATTGTVDPDNGARMDALRDYCFAGNQNVEGWLQPGALSILWSILEFQEETGIAGDLAEIGVYHGKLFLMLAMAARQDERAHAIDPFVMPKRRPFRAAFEANLDAFKIDRARVEIHEMLSEKITKQTARRFLGPSCRVISIDGAHTRENVLHDLALATECLSDTGVVAVDDFFNPWCADLTEGVFEFLRGEHGRNLVPFALAAATGPLKTGAPKLFLARPQSASLYIKALIRLNGRSLTTRLTLCGAETLIFAFSKGVRKAILFRRPVSDSKKR